MRKLIWALLMPATIFFGICHLVIFAVVDLFLMFGAFLGRASYKPFWITMDVAGEVIDYYCGIFKG